MSTKIEWTNETWNPIVGCSKVSPGCAHCYAETMAKRLKAMGRPEYQEVVNGDGRWTGKVTLVPERLDQPLRWRKPRMVFVNSMSDLFHENVYLFQQVNIWRTMADSPQHTYQILTKRPDAMKYRVRGLTHTFGILPNVWLGVSVEDQKTADERIPWLLKTRAAVRFVSCEPLLDRVDLSQWLKKECPVHLSIHRQGRSCVNPDAGPFLDWVIAGCESGPKRRTALWEWFQLVWDKARDSNTPFFLKQVEIDGKVVKMPELDGRVWDQFPND